MDGSDEETNLYMGPPPLDNCADQTAAYRLRNLMEDISEDYYAAGWLIGIEFILFDVAYAGETTSMFGGGLPHELVARLITLSQQCQGWWMWDEGRRFVSFDEWIPIYSKHYQPR